MQRRTFVTGSAGLAGMLSGCSSILGDSGGGDSGPEAVVESYWRALFDGDHEEANSYLHTNASVEPASEVQFADVTNGEYRVEGATIVDRSDSSVVVRISLYGQFYTMTQPSTIFGWYEVLQTDDGWRIYADVTSLFRGGEDGGQRAPTVHVETIGETNADGRVSAVVFRHATGDDIDVANLSVQMQLQTVESPSSDRTVQPGDAVRVPLDGGSSIPEGREIALLWTPSDSESSSVLAEHSLTAQTSGSLPAQFELELR